MLLVRVGESQVPKGVKSMITTLLFATLALAGTAGATPGRGGATRLGAALQPYVEVWLDDEGYYRRGERAHVYFQTDSDAFVTVFRIDTDGRVRVLFPHYPWDDNYVYGGRRYEVIEPYGSHGKYAFLVDEYPGQGYVFAVASNDPFDYRAFTNRDHWDYRAIATRGRVTGDPYVAFDALVEHILPVGYTDYAYDVYPYSVEQRYSYPRFLCYDCHSYVSYAYWNPYRYDCFRFRLVIYTDPFYYPARRYAGTRVVYKRPVRYEPRYVFKDRSGSVPFVTEERRRPVETRSGRRTVERGATGRDVGGVGRIPAPVTRRPAAPDAEARRSERRRVEASGPDRVTAPESRRPAERAAPRPATETNDVRGRSVEPTAKPQLERREPIRRPAPPGTTQVPRERRRPAPSQARPAPAPGGSQPSRARQEQRPAPRERPAVDRAPKRRQQSERQARPSGRGDAKAAPVKRAPPKERKPKKPDSDLGH